MANDRMYLYNPESGTRIFLAKHFGDRWETREHPGVGTMVARVNAGFAHAALDHNPISKAWKIVYETDDDFPEYSEFVKANDMEGQG